MHKILKRLRLANVVMVGGKEQNFYRDDQHHMILRDGVIIDITNKRTNETGTTSLFNATWWEEEKALVVEEAPAKAKKA